MLPHRRTTWLNQFVDWTLFIFTGVCFVFTIFIPETLAPVLLKVKAENMRKETGDDSYRTLAELEHRTLSQTIKIALLRPLDMLFTEPIVLFMTCCKPFKKFLLPLPSLTWQHFLLQISRSSTVYYVCPAIPISARMLITTTSRSSVLRISYCVCRYPRMVWKHHRCYVR